MDKSVQAWFANKELFSKMLREGHKWEMKVADILEGMGYEVERPPPIIEVGDVEDRHEYVDQKDVTANGVVIEVKSRKLDFSCAEDFPYPTLFVDTKSGFQAKKTKPRIYVCISQIGPGVVALDVDNTFAEWGTVRTWDQVRKIRLTAYDCRKELWRPLDEVCDRVIGKRQQ